MAEGEAGLRTLGVEEGGLALTRWGAAGRARTLRHWVGGALWCLRCATGLEVGAHALLDLGMVGWMTVKGAGAG